jgi:hypothetical protein
VVFCFRGDTDTQRGLHHWVCAVGCDTSAAILQIACSAAHIHHDTEAYAERKTGQGRWYNDTMGLGARVRLERGCALRIGLR